MNPLVRTLGYLLGIAYWIYLSVPRFDTQRRSSAQYRKMLGITKSIWICSCCLMLILMKAFPAQGVALSLALCLLTAFLCLMLLDELE